jgi:hypothetical protein
MTEQQLRQLIRNELSGLSEGTGDRVIAGQVDQAREKVEDGVIPHLERLLALVKNRYPDMSGWVESVLEDQVDVYRELQDLENKLRS